MEYWKSDQRTINNGFNTRGGVQMGEGLTPEIVKIWAEAVGYVLGDLFLLALAIGIITLVISAWKETHR